MSIGISLILWNLLQIDLIAVMSSLCWYWELRSWSLGLVSLQYLNSIRMMVGSAPFVMMMASGLDEGCRPVTGDCRLSTIHVKIPDSELRGSIGASSSVHFEAEPKSAIARFPPMLPLEMAFNRMRPVWLCLSVYILFIVGCWQPPAMWPTPSSQVQSGQVLLVRIRHRKAALLFQIVP